MRDIETARQNLGGEQGNTIALCLGDVLHTSTKKGVAPMLSFLEAGEDLHGFSVADMVVGRAAAMLFIKAGVCAVYAKVISKPAKRVLDAFCVPLEYGELVENIINRMGTDICPMEKSVLYVADTDIDTGYEHIKQKYAELAKM